MSFTDKVVLVTGSSGGIGAATAIQFAKEGAHVVIVGRNEEKLKKVNAQCQKYGKKPLVVKADVSNEADGNRIVHETIKKFGRIDVLVNNAGFVETVEITGGNFITVYDRIMDVNLRGVVLITYYAIPHLITSKGKIINISSVAGTATVGITDKIPYYVSKAAVNHFTRGTAVKLASYGVRVNTISPGPVRTDIIHHSSWDPVKEMTALKRVSEPEEIADLILFLASDKARGITGSDFLTDNGTLIKY